MRQNSKIFIAGHEGMVGSAILRKLRSEGFKNIILRTHEELDLTNQYDVQNFFTKEEPEYVILSAAKVGGIMANDTFRADFLYNNLMIQCNIINSAHYVNSNKLILIGCGSVYPKIASQSILEESLLCSDLEQTNEPHALAKIAGLKLCENYNRQYGSNFFTIIPCNLYGPNDNFDLYTSHVLAALLRKMHLAKCLEMGDWDSIQRDLKLRPIDGINGTESKQQILIALAKHGVNLIPYPTVEIWGTGQVYREFLFVDDLANAVYSLLRIHDIQLNFIESRKTQYFLNIGSGKEVSINNLALIVKDVTKFKGSFWYDHSKPDGKFRKLLNVNKIHELGWTSEIELNEGIQLMYKSYLSEQLTL